MAQAAQLPWVQTQIGPIVQARLGHGASLAEQTWLSRRYVYQD